MEIQGLQKMTLLDFPGKVACTVFLGGCDLRCPFCHNAELIGATPAVMDDTQLLSFLEKRRGLLDGVAITGGEPLLRRELPELIARIRALGFAVKLDTNGTHPAELKRIVSAGLVNYVAMDIKNSPTRYAQTAGLSHLALEPIRESVAFLLSGTVEYEFRTTVVEELHDADSFREIGPWIRGAKRYFLQPFADRDTVPYDGFHAPNQAQLEQYLRIMVPYVPATAIRGA